MGPGAYEFVNSKGETWYLHGRIVTLKNGRQQQIYWFCRDIRAESIEELPEGLTVLETARTGMPVLKKG